METASSKRPYRMGARAEASAATRQAICESWLALLAERHFDEITLEAVAARAGTTVPTVIRHFGSKDELFVAAFRRFIEIEMARRDDVRAGDVAGVIHAVVAHYDRVGVVVLRMREQEDRFPALGRATNEGRETHCAWVETVFAPQLARTAGAARRRLRGQLVAVTDVSMWKLLRRDQGFGKRQTQEAIVQIIEGLTTGAKDR